MDTRTPTRPNATAALASVSTTVARVTARSRLIHDWATRVLREDARDEALAVIDWLAVHGDRSYLGALATVGYRFPDDPVIAAASAVAITHIEARQRP